MPVALHFSQRADAKKPAGERAFFARPLPTRLTIGAGRPLRPWDSKVIDTRNSMRSLPQIPAYPADTAFHRFPAEKVAVA